MSQGIKHFIKNNKGIVTGIVAIFIALIFSFFPSLAEVIYRKGLFQIVRIVVDYSIALLPFPVVYLVVIIIPFFLYFHFKRRYTSLINLITIPLNLFGWLVTIFLMMWGYNYTCDDKVPLDRHKRITSEQLYVLGTNTAQQAVQLREKIEAVEFSYTDCEIRDCMEKFCNTQDILTFGRVQCKDIVMSGFMRRMGVAGIYLPFTGESYCDGTFPDVVKVFIKAHEMSHGYGITNEGEADYYAYAALSQQTNRAELIYSAKLELLRSIRSQLHIRNDSMRKALDSNLSEKVLSDIVEIRMDALKYKEYYPGLQTEFNDTYLKMMGIQEGVQSYDRFVELVYQNPR